MSIIPPDQSKISDTYFHISFNEKGEAGLRAQGDLQKIANAMISAAKTDEKLRALFAYVYVNIAKSQDNAQTQEKQQNKG